MLVGIDATREEMLDGLRKFSVEAATADWAVVYYSGHGMEVNGTNYLVPVDANFSAGRDGRSQVVSLDQVMAATQGARKLRLILLDACRNNPFVPPARPAEASRATVAMGATAVGLVGERATGGLGAVNVSGAMLVVYATKHGQTALDGQGTNSPFAVAMVQRLATPNVEINKLFRLVARRRDGGDRRPAGALHLRLAARERGLLLRAEIGAAAPHCCRGSRHTIYPPPIPRRV